MENRKEWNEENIYKSNFLKEVKDGDLVTMDNVTFIWLDAFDRPQKRINDENGKFLKYELDYGE